MTNLMSGALGALFVFLLQLWIERLRIRAECTLAVADWLGDLQTRTTSLLVSKSVFYQSGQSSEDYDENSRQLTRMLIHTGIQARIAIAVGEGRELELLKSLTTEIDGAIRAMRQARAETWPDIERVVRERFTTVVDPLQRELVRRMLWKARPSAWLFDRAFVKKLRGRGSH